MHSKYYKIVLTFLFTCAFTNGKAQITNFINQSSSYNSIGQTRTYTYSIYDRSNNNGPEDFENYIWTLSGGGQIIGQSNNIVDVQWDDYGYYTISVTADRISDGFTISSNIQVMVDCISRSERLDLLEFYNETNGDAWTNTLANNKVWNDNDTPVCDWYGVTVTNGNVTGIDLNSNNLSGSIPPEIEDLISLKNLYLYQNSLTGNIPPEIWNLTELVQLSLHTNQLTGTISPLIGNLINLEYLYLYSNKLTGTIPTELGSLTNMITISLSNNQLTGEIPEELGNLSNLYRLYLLINNLEGEIPSELGQLNNLQRLSLGYNNLTGPIPYELGNMTALEDLWLPNNNFTSLPSSLENLPILRSLDVQNNNISGIVPSNLKNITTLDDVRVRNNAFIFSDFEGEHSIYSGYTIYNYSPQSKVDQEETVNLTEGSSYTITTRLSSPNNHYQWQHSTDGGTIWTTVGTDTNAYTITSATAADAGMYRFLATNDIVNGLTLTRNTVFVNVMETGLSNVCISGASILSSARSSEAYTDLTISMLDNSNISHLNATITKGYWNNEEFTLNKVFDSLGHISFSCTKESDCNGKQFFDQFEIEYNIESSSGTYQGIQMFFADSIIDERLYDGGVTANFECFYTPDNDNTFCLSDYEDEIIMANLFPRGDNILWYATETGGAPYNNDYDFIDDVFDVGGTITYWWDDTTDDVSTRTSAQVIVYDSPEGDEEQSFSAYQSTSPTLEDIDIVNGDDTIYWYNSSTGGTLLSSSITLIDGQTYYASSCDVGNNDCDDCRLPVTISIGVIPPKGDPLQFLCEQSTLSDIALDIENGLSVVWYDSETGGSILGGTTPIINGTTYYAAQKDTETEEESDDRLAVLVYLLNSPEPRVTETTQTFYTADLPTVNDLRAFGYTINWYSQPSGGTLYDVNTPLEDGVTYYAEQESRAMCPSINRVGVKVILSEEPADPLVGCELFRPELSGHYVINAWVNERDVDSEIIDQEPFNNSEESELFVDLLNHLKNRFLSEDKSLHDFPPVYEPEFTGGEQQIDFAPLMNYINGLSTSEKKLIVYDFQPIYDDYYAPGLGRAIGFSFYLNSTKSSQFRYLTPTFTYNVPVVSDTVVIQTPVTEHYPLMNNEGSTPNEFLNFTNVEVNETTGVFTIYSSFNQITEPLYSQSAPTYSQSNIEGTDSDPYVMKYASIKYEYTEAVYQASPTYDKAKIEVSFVDVDNNAIGTPVELQPHGPIIDKWQQVSADFIIPNNAGRMKITIKNTDDNRFAYFDDIRIHPFDSNMKTFVYHPETQRLMSELDENNYATFYEYDLEGGLVRVKKETEKGIYTIQETRSGNVKATN